MDLKALNSLFNDKNKQLELLNKFQPGFLKFDLDGKIEINRTVKLNIPLENITFSQDRNFTSSTNRVENNFDDSLSSKGSINSNINISKSIKNIFNINFENKLKLENNNESNKKSNSIHYKHLIYNSFVKISIQQKDFNLDENIKQELRNVMKKESDKEKLNELFKIYNKYGIGVPFEFILGGKYYIYFDAKNNEEKDEIVNNINNITSFSLNENNKADLDVDYNKKNEIKKKMENLNIQMSVIGGIPEKKDDYNEWLKSLTLDNMEIIQYKSLIALHEFCDDVKDEIENLLERENNRKSEERKKIEEERKREEEERQNQKIITDLASNEDIDDDDNFEPISINVLGDNDSGKTCFIKKYTKGTFKELEQSTVDNRTYSRIKKIIKDNKEFKIKVQLNDFAVNHNRINDLDLSYLKSSDGIILICDVSKPDSFERLDIWKKVIKNYKKIDTPVYLIPNKIDLNLNYNNQKLNSFCSKSIILMKGVSCKNPNDINIETNMNIIIEKVFSLKKKKRSSIVYKDEEKKSSGCW